MKTATSYMLIAAISILVVGSCAWIGQALDNYSKAKARERMEVWGSYYQRRLRFVREASWQGDAEVWMYSVAYLPKHGNPRPFLFAGTIQTTWDSCQTLSMMLDYHSVDGWVVTYCDPLDWTR